MYKEAIAELGQVFKLSPEEIERIIASSKPLSENANRGTHVIYGIPRNGKTTLGFEPGAHNFR